MRIFKKREKLVFTELKCPAEGCFFTCNDHNSLKRHVEWKHAELVRSDFRIAGMAK